MNLVFDVPADVVISAAYTRFDNDDALFAMKASG